MSKLIPGIVTSYEKNGVVKKLAKFGQPNDRFPFDVFPQGCIRLSVFLGRYGDKAASVLQAFVDGNPIQATDTVGYSEYQGNKLIVLSTGPNDRQPLQFGAGKAKKIIEVLAKYGMGDLQVTLTDVIGETKSSDSPAPRKGKAKGKGKGQGGSGSPKTIVEADIEDIPVQAPKAAPVTPDLDTMIEQHGLMIRHHFAEVTRLQAELRAMQAQRV